MVVKIGAVYVLLQRGSEVGWRVSWRELLPATVSILIPPLGVVKARNIPKYTHRDFNADSNDAWCCWSVATTSNPTENQPFGKLYTQKTPNANWVIFHHRQLFLEVFLESESGSKDKFLWCINDDEKFILDMYVKKKILQTKRKWPKQIHIQKISNYTTQMDLF